MHTTLLAFSLFCTGTIAPSLKAAGEPYPLFPIPAIATGRQPYGMAIADLNNDGLDDVIVTNSYDSSISLYYAIPRAGFSNPSEISTSAKPVYATTADLNNDGILDIVVASIDTSKVDVLLGKSDGTFADFTTYPANAQPETLKIYDLDGDGNLDILAAGAFGFLGRGYFSTLLGNGDGTFAPTRLHSAPVPQQDIEIADINGDSIPDLICSGYAGAFTMLGNMDGSYTEGPKIPIDHIGLQAQLTDANGDAQPDLILATKDENGIVLLQGQGDGTFVQTDFIPLPDAPRTLSLSDTDGDGKLDIVTTTENLVLTLHRNEAGDFSPPAQQLTASDIVAHAATDMNTDGRTDLAILSRSFSRVSFLVRGTDSTYLNAEASEDTGFPHLLLAADLNNDSFFDVLMQTDEDIYVRLGSSTGVFTEPTLVYKNSSFVQYASLEDLNDDPYPDLILFDRGSWLGYLINTGDGSFTDRVGIPSGGRPADFVFIDFTGDGYNDVAVIDIFLSELTLVPMFPPPLLPGPPITYPLPAKAEAITKGDFNQDSIPDLAILSTNSVQFLLGTASGGFAEGSRLTLERPASILASRDLNRDGFDDLVLAGNNTSGMSIYFGNAGKIFGAPLFIDTRKVARNIYLTDLNSDSYDDLIFTEFSRGELNIIYSRPDPHPDTMYLSHAQGYYPDASVINFSFLDADADGDIDFVSSGHGALVILRNQFVTSTPDCPADLNGDGRLNFFDVSAFLTAFNAQDPVADFNDDGSFNFFDVSAYLSAFNAGCP